jgi:hypothetical protein
MQLRPPDAPVKKPGNQMPAWCSVLFEPQWRYISVRGGRGSGKTKNFARALVLRSTVEKLRVLCTREVQLSIRESVYATIVNEIASLGWKVSSKFFRMKSDPRKAVRSSFAALRQKRLTLLSRSLISTLRGSKKRRQLAASRLKCYSQRSGRMAHKSG